MWNIGALFGAALLGFCAGLWSFRVKSRWCPACGRATYPLADRRGG
jgi:NADH pyrophosphatase NudC (nudix superfamily)